MFARLSLAVQATLIAGSCLVVWYAVQLAWLARGGDPALVLLLPVVGGASGVWLYTRFVHRVRLHAMHAAFDRLAQGDLDFDLPKAPDAESIPVEAAWTSMRRALRDLTDRLSRADAVRRQLFADLAHELGTPVATVVALADGLALPAVDADTAQRTELIGALIGEGMRLSRLVGDLRDLAELDDPDAALSRAPTDVALLTRDVVRRLELARPDAARTMIAAPESLVVDIDPERFEQIVVNLVGNAQRYTPRTGTIDVTLEPAPDAVRLVVSDSGEGVPDTLLPRLGERLLRPDRSRTRRTGGSGLGLSIVRAIARRHRGMVEFARARLGGLRVEVTLGCPETSGEGLPSSSSSR